jgi:hypothetical protein
MQHLTAWAIHHYEPHINVTDEHMEAHSFSNFHQCKTHELEFLEPGQLAFDAFRCRLNDECVHATERCNGIPDCADESDEEGCSTSWGSPAVLGYEACSETFISDLQFQCADGIHCTHIHARCNGVSNCPDFNGAPDNSDEEGCAFGASPSVSLEATTGFETSIVPHATIGSHVFFDRDYTFDSLGGLADKTFIKMSNDDKFTENTHVQMKLRLPRPLTVYVAKLTDHPLPWLSQQGWALSSMEGVTYHGRHSTRHKEWIIGVFNDDAHVTNPAYDTVPVEHYGPSQVYEKTFPAGTVELNGNGGGDGSYLIFVGDSVPVL